MVLATSIAQDFVRLMLTITGVSFDTNTRHVLLQVSTDNGSSYDTTDANYDSYNFTGAVAGATLLTGINIASSASAANFSLSIDGYQAGMYPISYGHGRVVGVGADVIWAAYNASTDAINALRLIVGGGASNFDAGDYALYGVR